MTVPFLRWVGGKSKLLPSLLPLLPENYKERRYVEPFLGGGAMFFALEPKEALLADINQDLVFTYAAVRDQLPAVLVLLKELAREDLVDGDKQYLGVRLKFNRRQERDWMERAAWFIYLNKCCFNGIWRVNRDGLFNVPRGQFKAGPNIVNEDVLSDASASLKTAEFLHSDFEDLLNEAWEGDFIYLDPPYVPLHRESFTSYTPGNFTLDDHHRLAAVFKKLHERGCMLMLSNSSTDLVRELYADFHITEVMAPRSVNSDTTARGCVPELVVRNYNTAVAASAA